MPSIVLGGTLPPCRESRFTAYSAEAPWTPRRLYAEGEGDGIRLTLVQVGSTVLFRGSWPLLALRHPIPFEMRGSLLPSTLVKATMMSYRDVPLEIRIVIDDEEPNGSSKSKVGVLQG